MFYYKFIIIKLTIIIIWQNFITDMLTGNLNIDITKDKEWQ